MALKTNALVEGKLIRTSSRSVTRGSDGQVFTFHTALVVGDHTMAELSVPEELLGDIPQSGDDIRAVISVDIYRGEVQTRLEEILPAKSAPVSKPHAA